MKKIRVEKVTLNVGAGKNQSKLEKSKKLLKKVTGIEPVTTYAKKRIPGWKLRPGLPIGCKITLRNEEANELIPRLLTAKENVLKESQIDKNGNISFGIAEYINIHDIKYDPDIGVIGFEVCITLERPGYRVKKRRLKRGKIPKRHRISKEEAKEFLKEEFKVKFGEEE